MEMGSNYAEVRKRTNTDIEPKRITQLNILEYILTKSQNNIQVRKLLVQYSLVCHVLIC